MILLALGLIQMPVGVQGVAIDPASARVMVSRACVVHNDLALGRMAEQLTHSSFWKSIAILVVEDDAQNSVDHIDGNRTVALVASPFGRRGTIDSTFCNQSGMARPSS